MCGEIERGPNKRTVLRVTYKSGRVEEPNYGTEAAARRAKKGYERIETVKRATILKNKVSAAGFGQTLLT